MESRGPNRERRRSLVKGGQIPSEDSKGYRQVVLRLRWVTIIVTSYLILFGRGIDVPQLLPSLLIVFYLVSNVIAYLIPPSYFLRIPFFYTILLFDTLMVSLGIYLTSQFDSDFYLVYFFIIFFASIARSFKLLMVNALLICAIYGWFLWTRGLTTEGLMLRIPFIFIMNLFYGFFVQSFEERAKRFRMELKEVEESEQRYRQIVEGAHDAVAILDENDRIKFFNGRLLQLTENASEELTGMELTKLLDGGESIRGLVHSLSLREKPRIQEADVLQKSGESKRVEISASRVFLANNKAHTILYLKDITERKEMEERLIQSEKLRALGEMAAGVAHDFNNVLGAILGRAQLIRMGLQKSSGNPSEISVKKIQKELEVIEQAAADGAHTIRKIREFTRKRSDEGKFVPVDVDAIIGETIELMKTKIKDEAEAKGAPIEARKIKGEVCPVMGNPSELKEVLVNLLLNAIDAMPKGGTITFRTGMDNGYVWIEVSDNGMGMPDFVRYRIFDPFFTTKGVQRSGLGLSVSYGVISRHHGEIAVESREGAGSTFRIKLPAARESRSQ
jgi:PAS domain S-box-containing protein